jgi:uncharacterized protein DUF1257
MSHIAQVETEIRDLNALVAALEEINPAWKEQVIVDTNGTTLHGYAEDRQANVVIRTRSKGSFGDIGFLRTESGKYRLIVDDLDLQHMGGKSWIDRLTRTYAKHVILDEAERSGQEVLSEETRADGSIKIMIEVD